MVVPEPDEANSSTDATGVTYGYKPSLVGSPFEFRLTPDALEWRRGESAGRTPYGRVRRIRLGFRPITMQTYRFFAEIWVADGSKLQIASTSWKSLVEHQRFDSAYRTFVTELCRRVGGADGPTVFQTGSPVVINTSLNTAGRPIVDHPRDALECFGSAPIDALAIGPFLVRRSASFVRAG